MLYDDVNCCSSQKKKVKKDSNGPGTCLAMYPSTYIQFLFWLFFMNTIVMRRPHTSSDTSLWLENETIDDTIQAVSLTLIRIECRDHRGESLQLMVRVGLELRINGFQIQDPKLLATLSPLVILTTAYRHTCILFICNVSFIAIVERNIWVYPYEKMHWIQIAQFVWKRWFLRLSF